jgi:hypothetical protein
MSKVQASSKMVESSRVARPVSRSVLLSSREGTPGSSEFSAAVEEEHIGRALAAFDRVGKELRLL